MENEEQREQETVRENISAADQTMNAETEVSAPAVEEVKPEVPFAEEESKVVESAVAEDVPAVQERQERKPRPQIDVTQEMVDKASSTLMAMLDYLGLEGTVKAEKKPSKINLLVASDDAGRIIGRKGQSLESLQLLLNRMMQNSDEEFPKVYIDIDGYSSKNATAPDGKPRREREERSEGRSRRDGRRENNRFERRRGGRSEDEGGYGDKDEILRQQALDAAKEVRRWGESKELPPMNSHDRRIIHITLEGESDLTTDSVGEGSMKSVVIAIKK